MSIVNKSQNGTIYKRLIGLSSRMIMRDKSAQRRFLPRFFPEELAYKCGEWRQESHADF